MGSPRLTQTALAMSVLPHPAVALMARETRVREGVVPRSLGDGKVADGQWQLRGGAFLLRADGGIGLYYERGQGVTIQRPHDADSRDVELWRNGTLYAAIAALNGLYPLHASAVANDGQVHAFTGPAGAGKSTLVAALGASGFAQFCDDTLIIDLSESGAPLCLPGHKRLKLWREGAVLAEVEPGERVASNYAKHFVEPAAGAATEPLPLAELIFLDTGAEASIEPIEGGARIARLHDDDHYTAQLWSLVNRQSRAERFSALAALARRVPMRRFVRPFDPARFGESVACIAAHIQAVGR